MKPSHIPITFTTEIAGLPFLGDGQITAFLCGKCDKTHLQLDCALGTFLLSLEPQAAETLGQELINPRPVPPEQINTIKVPQ